MNREEKQKLIDKLLARRVELQETCAAFDAIGLSIESDLQHSLWSTFDDYLDLVSIVVGDKSEWLAWYVFENNSGTGGLTASLSADENAPMILIDTTSKLLDLIEG